MLYNKSYQPMNAYKMTTNYVSVAMNLLYLWSYPNNITHLEDNDMSYICPRVAVSSKTFSFNYT